MKELYTKPVVELEEFKSLDVVTTSSGGTDLIIDED